MKNKILIASFLILGVLGLMFGFKIAKADTDVSNYPPIIQKLIERFNLDPDEVQEVIEEERGERRFENQARFEERLNEMLENGEISESQKQAILEKHEEFQNRMQELWNLSPEERKEAMDQLREEMRNWAEENGIGFNCFFGFGMGGGHRGFSEKGFGQRNQSQNNN